jgi:hypothetical protein
MAHIRVRAEGPKVLIDFNGKVELMPWDAAKDFARGLLMQALKAEEFAKAEGIIYDNAILLRAGFPVGLSDDPLIRRETAIEAQHDASLRRYMPGGVLGKSLPGTPTIVRKEPQ